MVRPWSAPGYFVLLGAWVPLAGDADFALRYLSLLPSVASVALIYTLGRRLDRWFGHEVRRGKLHLDQSPPSPNLMPLHLSQMHPLPAAACCWRRAASRCGMPRRRRMYASLLALSLVFMWAQWELLKGNTTTRSTWGWAAAYACATAGVVYLHLYEHAAAAGAGGLCGGLDRGAPRRAHLCPRWTLAALAALLLFAPWLPHALGIFGFSGWHEGGSAADRPGRYWLAYTVSDGLAEPWARLAAMAVSAAAGGRGRLLVACAPRRRPLPAGVVDRAAGRGLCLAVRNPDYHERYTIFLTAPFCCWWRGVWGCWERSRDKNNVPERGVLPLNPLRHTPAAAGQRAGAGPAVYRRQPAQA